MGYLGPVTVKHLRMLCPEAVLIGYDNAYFAHCLTNASDLPERYVNLQYFGDIRIFPESLLSGLDVVVHLAAISNDPIGNVNEEVTLDVNYRSSVMLAKKAKEFGVKSFVFASSCSVYGFAEDGAKSEESPVNPLTAYAKSKVLTENDLKLLADKNFNVTCLRFSTACGMSARLRLDLVLNDFVASAITLNKIQILSDGSPWRPLININDMARAIDWAINRKNESGKEFIVVNIGSEEWNYKIKELADAVVKIIPGVEVSINKDAQPDKRSYKVNFERFKKLAPQHQPQYDLIKTIMDLKNGLNEMVFQEKDFRNSSFIRLKVLENLRNSKLLSSDFKWIK